MKKSRFSDSQIMAILNHKRVVRALDQIIEWRGKPSQIRCDNGSEYISATLAA